MLEHHICQTKLILYISAFTSAYVRVDLLQASHAYTNKRVKIYITRTQTDKQTEMVYLKKNLTKQEKKKRQIAERYDTSF